MGCRTPSVQRAANKTAKAMEAVKGLEDKLKGQSEEVKKIFEGMIQEHMEKAKINDGREIEYNQAIKVEYTQEFSLDAITKVVIEALNTVKTLTDPQVKNPATSPEAIECYKDVVVSVAEAAKSSSKTATSLNFSMNRLSPGLYAFLYATSTNIQDKETFGTETVTATAIYYAMYQSIQDVQQEANYELAHMEKANLLKMKTLQAGLTDDLGNGALTIEQWTAKDAAYEKACETIEKRLKDLDWDSHTENTQPIPHNLVESHLKHLEGLGHKDVAETTRKRLNAGYYGPIDGAY